MRALTSRLIPSRSDSLTWSRSSKATTIVRDKLSSDCTLAVQLTPARHTDPPSWTSIGLSVNFMDGPEKMRICPARISRHVFKD